MNHEDKLWGAMSGWWLGLRVCGTAGGG